MYDCDDGVWRDALLSQIDGQVIEFLPTYLHIRINVNNEQQSPGRHRTGRRTENRTLYRWVPTREKWMGSSMNDCNYCEEKNSTCQKTRLGLVRRSRSHYDRFLPIHSCLKKDKEKKVSHAAACCGHFVSYHITPSHSWIDLVSFATYYPCSLYTHSFIPATKLQDVHPSFYTERSHAHSLETPLPKRHIESNLVYHTSITSLTYPLSLICLYLTFTASPTVQLQAPSPSQPN